MNRDGPPGRASSRPAQVRVPASTTASAVVFAIAVARPEKQVTADEEHEDRSPSLAEDEHDAAAQPRPPMGRSSDLVHAGNPKPFRNPPIQPVPGAWTQLQEGIGTRTRS